MPVKQLLAICWTASGDEDGRHYDRPGDGDDLKPLSPLPSPCFIAVCDGKPGDPCGEEMGDCDEFDVLHFRNPADAGAFAGHVDWQISPDGVVQCPDDEHEEASPDDH